jgi:hypothetical protein
VFSLQIRRYVWIAVGHRMILASPDCGGSHALHSSVLRMPTSFDQARRPASEIPDCPGDQAFQLLGRRWNAFSPAKLAAKSLAPPAGYMCARNVPLADTLWNVRYKPRSVDLRYILLSVYDNAWCNAASRSRGLGVGQLDACWRRFKGIDPSRESSRTAFLLASSPMALRSRTPGGGSAA